MNETEASSQPIAQKNKETQPSSPRRHKILKIILGITTLWPIVYFPTLLLSMYLSLIILFGNLENIIPFYSSVRYYIFNLYVMSVVVFLYPTIILTIILSFIYIIIVYKNRRISNKQKALWAVILFFGNLITMPIYWYRYIRKEPKQNQAPEKKI